jgi:hypothetical protein
MISKQVKICSNKELTSAPRNEEANTQRHSFIAGLHVDRPKMACSFRNQKQDKKEKIYKKEKPTIVQFVN